MTARFSIPPHEIDGNLGRVITSQRSESIVEDTKGQQFTCLSRKRVGRTVCGDYVVWSGDEKKDHYVESIIPRQNELKRPDANGKIKVLAANIDQLIVVASPVPAIDLELIDRYLVAANLLKIPAAILLNKADLLADQQIEEFENIALNYRVLGYQVLMSSTKVSTGLTDLRALCDTKTSVLVGQSGVGKSSLIRHLIPESDARVGAISTVHREGKHTTTETTLYHVPTGGSLVDSPGVRSFRLWNLDKDDVMWGFAEFKPLLGECRFHNCVHLNEPGCAIKAALKAKKISPNRYRSYCEILQSLDKNY